MRAQVVCVPLGTVLKQALLDENSIYIVTPFYSGGEVFDVLMDSGRFEEDEARLMFRQVLDGLLHLKTHGVCHR